jgi:hypothetical protein
MLAGVVQGGVQQRRNQLEGVAQQRRALQLVAPLLDGGGGLKGSPLLPLPLLTSVRALLVAGRCRGERVCGALCPSVRSSRPP